MSGLGRGARSGGAIIIRTCLRAVGGPDTDNGGWAARIGGSGMYYSVKAQNVDPRK